MGRRSLSGSNIGGIAETQEMLDFCGELATSLIGPMNVTRADAIATAEQKVADLKAQIEAYRELSTSPALASYQEK